MRLFLAIDLPEAAKAALAQQLVPLQKEYPVFNWVQPQNYHLTVHFFGETPKSKEIIEKTKQILYDQEQFYLYATEIDFFMKKNVNITIYLTFRRERLLEELIGKARDAFEQEFRETNPFVPHITLARCRIPSRQQYFHMKKKIQRVGIDLEFPVKAVTLFESIISDRKPVYREVVRIPLAEKLL